MEKEGKTGGKNIPATQEEFNELADAYMDRGEEEALFALLQECPDFMRQYAREIEKELGLQGDPVL